MKNLEEKWRYLTKWLQLKSNFGVLAENVCLLVQRQPLWMRKRVANWNRFARTFSSLRIKVKISLRMTECNFFEIEKHMKWYRQHQVSLERKLNTQSVCISTVTQTVESVTGKLYYSNLPNSCLVLICLRPLPVKRISSKQVFDYFQMSKDL